jgi:hypothetical protein
MIDECGSPTEVTASEDRPVPRDLEADGEAVRPVRAGGSHNLRLAWWKRTEGQSCRRGKAYRSRGVTEGETSGGCATLRRPC